MNARLTATIDGPGEGSELAGHKLSVGVLVERRYLNQLQPSGMITALRAQGHQVSVIDPEDNAYRIGDETWLRGLDLVVTRGRSWAVLSLLSWAEACGVPTINHRSAIAAVHNKADMAVTLAAGRVPTPATLVGSLEALAQHVSANEYPLVLKPVFGDNGNGLRLVGHAGQITSVPWHDSVALAQRYVPGDGRDVKIYCIADETWVVRKPSSAPALRVDLPYSPLYAAEPELMPLTPELRAIADQCRRLFHLELFGVDCIETSRGPVVIEVNEFPNYSAVPNASARLADYVCRRALLGRGL